MDCLLYTSAEFFLYDKKLLCIGDGRLDFQTVFHDAVKVHQPFPVFVGHLRHLRGIEIAKGFAVAFPLFEDGYQMCIRDRVVYCYLTVNISGSVNTVRQRDSLRKWE